MEPGFEASVCDAHPPAGVLKWATLGEGPQSLAVQYPGQVGLRFFGSPPVTGRKFPGVYVPSCLGPSSCVLERVRDWGRGADLAQSSCDESGSFR